MQYLSKFELEAAWTRLEKARGKAPQYDRRSTCEDIRAQLLRGHPHTPQDRGQERLCIVAYRTAKLLELPKAVQRMRDITRLNHFAVEYILDDPYTSQLTTTVHATKCLISLHVGEEM